VKVIPCDLRRKDEYEYLDLPTAAGHGVRAFAARNFRRLNGLSVIELKDESAVALVWLLCDVSPLGIWPVDQS
jgi:hypothetical protein